MLANIRVLREGNFEFLCETGSWVIAFQGFVDQGEILNTPQGFYRKVVI